MKLVFLTGALIALNLTTLTGACASSVKTLPYGSRMGMQVTVVNEQGIGTSHAVIRTRHTTADAHAYCAEYVLNDSQECVRQAMKDTPVHNKVTADCRTGEFTDLYGDRFRFEGPATGSDTDAQFNIRREADGTLLDGSGASGYGVAFSIFSALCPKAVPAGERTAGNESSVNSSDGPLGLPKNRADIFLIYKALINLQEFYGDIPSATRCESPESTAMEIICGSPYLKMAELLSTRLQAYDEENATKSDIDHSSFRGVIPTSCKTELCIYNFFKDEINSALGDDSPYSSTKANNNTSEGNINEQEDGVTSSNSTDSDLGNLNLSAATVTATCYASEVEISDIDMSAADVARRSRIPQAFSIAIDPSNGDWSVNGTSIKPWKFGRFQDGDPVTVIPAASFAMAKANGTFNAMAAMGGADAAQALRSKLIGPVLSSMLKDRYAFFDVEKRQLGFFTLKNGKTSRLTGARCQ